MKFIKWEKKRRRWNTKIGENNGNITKNVILYVK